MNRLPEILAPVGSEEALIAAVRSGADAVYFGSGSCNARRGAGSFEGDALLHAVQYCHARNVRVYVTVNTLLRDEELANVADTLTDIAASGADGIIVQDMAVVPLAKAICPDLALHASTQMAVHNAAGVTELEQLGFSRVVLARELTGTEIAKIREQTHAELEVFVHGALCMSASGMCYLSASLGERSGNRGTCAQPCRLPFVCNGAQNCLSLKDMSHLDHLEELSRIGVTSFKIEGRLKRPEYVAATVDAARRARDGETYSVDGLRAVFSRSGFTDGYYTGKRNHTMFGTRSQEDADRSKEVLSSYRELYRSERASVPVSVNLSIREGQPVCLSVSDGTNAVTLQGEAPQIARTTPATKESVGRSVAKTGGTPFFVTNITAEIDPGLMVPSSVLNALRREALEKLLALREKTPRRTIRTPNLSLHGSGRHANDPKYIVRFANAEQVFSHPAIAVRTLPVEQLLAHPELIDESIWCELPDLCYPMDEERLSEQLKSLYALGVRDAMLGNIGMVRPAREAGMRLHGAFGLNVTNRLACEQYAALGFESLTVSFELSYPKMRDLHSSIPLGCIVAGRLPLMQFRSCPARTATGCGACNGSPVLTDRTGRTFPIVCHQRQYSTLLNSVLYDTADKRLPELDYYQIHLTIETKEEAKALFESVLRGEKPEAERTTGMSFRNLL